MWSNAHDSMNAGHGRNFKKLGWPLKDLRTSEGFCIRVFDIEYQCRNPSATVYQYSDSFAEIALEKSLNLAVRGGHLGILQPPRETRPGSWKSWKSMVHTVKNAPWGEAFESDPLAEMGAKPAPCRVCGTKCKLAGDTTAGAIGPPKHALHDKETRLNH